jgi:hypothetical protein
MLDRVERWRFLVEPAGKNPAPVLVRSLNVDLDERARQFLFFPRRGRFAGAQANDQVPPPRRLPGMQRDILHDAVALVEDAEHRDALRHRRRPALPGRGRRHVLARGRRIFLLMAATAARSQRERNQQRCSSSFHAYSGIQGS